MGCTRVPGIGFNYSCSQLFERCLKQTCHIECQVTHSFLYSRVGECFLERLMQPQLWADQVYYRCESGQKFADNLVKLHAFTLKVIRDRKEEILNQSNVIRYKRTANGYTEMEEGSADRRKAFLDLLLGHHITTGELTEEDIREEVDTFMFEGSSMVMMNVFKFGVFCVCAQVTTQRQWPCPGLSTCSDTIPKYRLEQRPRWTPCSRRIAPTRTVTATRIQ